MQQYLLALEIDSFLQNEDQVLQRLTRAATFKQTDYLTFKVALQGQRLAVQKARALYQNDIGTLNYLCGIDDSSWTVLKEPLIADSALTPFENTPYFRGSKLDSIKNSSDAKIIKLNYKPKISIFADGGYQSSLISQAYKNIGTSIGLTLTLPLYDGHQRRLSLLQNKLLENTRKGYTDYYHKQYNQQIIQLTQQLDQYESIINEGARQLIYAQTLVQANKKQLTTGDIRMTDYLLSINNYLNLRSAVIQNQMIRLSILNQLHHIILK
ncbi:TolC family protein [Arachidicoccus ginsenosidivorans]|uniref:TolC family protein n=1 Tax=Arachidicoccus ginsenosidivorans TaxID=496057 RepID=UPI0013154394|nr:TolC family protein [Arachidicoccus ginsenosidivorans]